MLNPLSINLRAALLGCLLFASASAEAQVAKLPPVDEAPRDPGFLAFRTRLLQVIEERDVEGLLRVVSPDIQICFGDREGIDDFRSSWKLDSPNSDLWNELSSVLRLGGIFSHPDSFDAPYVYANFPDQLGAFDHVAVIGDDVRVRARPSVDASVLTTLSFDIVAFECDSTRGRADCEIPPVGWSRIRLADDRIGFVATRYLRSPIDYRAGFTRRNGTWILAFFVAGD